ncbi:tetratricopeptide repeat protein [Chthonobacter albigriseus]|uniref:tetratricopeptide repeat protein n=1 Tax=Chthonobacter albigriseus TaxID=1683161 RepID=UPI0015EF22C8|nr:tetratricopeptide repeat protein [Chthonobacter albigriseus]
MRSRLLAATFLAAAWCAPVHAEIVARPTPTAGAVIDVKTGEEIAFVDSAGWHGVDITQAVLSGDTLRTNALGQLAVLFADQTQIRVGRNTTLVVKEVGPAGARLAMPAGAIWARAARGGSGVTIDTPAAAAAIRGTDWSLAVGPDGRTTLVVMEGAVELSNPQGSVTVRQGEAAVAAIGEKPTKIILVDIDDREQMLFYVSLRGAYTFLPASPLPSRSMLAERRRLAGQPDEALSTDDLVTRAELAISFDGVAAAEAAVATARARRLSAGQAARLDLVEALIAGARTRYGDAARLFARALPRLDPGRRDVAAYGGYFARALADPSRVEQPPAMTSGGPYAALAEAYAVGHQTNPRAAIAVIERAERRWPDEAVLPAVRAMFALLDGDREGMRAAVERAVSLDPENPVVLHARAEYRSGILSDLPGAEADLKKAIALQPGNADLWNSLGLLYQERGATREAEAAMRRAIELEPEDPVSYVNQSILYLDQNRLDEAKTMIDEVGRRDPAFHVVHLARGRYHLARGENDLAIQEFLKASVANPAYSNALLLLSAAYYQNGDFEPAAQALENAARLDPNDPSVPLFATAIAIDQYRSDEAIESARHALELQRLRGGVYASVGASRETGSTVANAFRFAGLDAWGRAYSDIAFDPFVSTGYIDQAISGTPNPFFTAGSYGQENPDYVDSPQSFSSLFQGLLLDPLSISAPSKQLQIVRAPFLEAEIGAGYAFGDGEGPTASVQVQGFSQTPIPVSVAVAANLRRFDQDSSTFFDDPNSATVLVGATPTPNDRALLFGTYSESETGYTGEPNFLGDAADVTSARAGQLGLGWSHTIGDRNVVNAALYAARSHVETSQILLPILTRFDSNLERGSYLAALNHMVALNDAVTLRYGVEAGHVTADDTTTINFANVVFDTTDSRTDTTFGRLYTDVIAKPTDALTLEAGVVAAVLDETGDDPDPTIEPRVGLAFAAFEGHTVRLAAMRETLIPSALTLGPVGVVGIQSAVSPVETGGQVDTLAVRWDAEWSSRFFTSLEYRRQYLGDVSIDPPAALPFDLDEGTIDRVSLTANAAVGGGFGLFGTVAYARSEGEQDSDGAGVPFIPDWSARAGLTFVHPSRFKATLAATYVGERDSNDGATLGDYVTVDSSLSWESPDRTFQFELSGYNLLDEDFTIASGVPGWGRTVIGTATVRF